ncbi:MAG: hypothetical protein LUP99_04510, partial [Methanomicrobiales archaeon]|nr:hypothetical protein [Methanomicrobiales archaeon]
GGGLFRFLSLPFPLLREQVNILYEQNKDKDKEIDKRNNRPKNRKNGDVRNAIYEVKEGQQEGNKKDASQSVEKRTRKIEGKSECEKNLSDKKKYGEGNNKSDDRERSQ